MLTNPLVTLLLNVLLAALGGYLMNQLPAIPDFRGRKVLILWLTFEVTVLSLIVSGWEEFFSKSPSSFQIAVKTLGVIVLLLFVWHTFQLVYRIYQARKQGNLTNHNSTKVLKSADDWRRELLKAIKLDVEARLDDSLHNQEMIRVGREEQPEAVGRQPLTKNKSNTSLSSGWLKPKRWLKIFSGGTSELDSGKPIIEVFDKSDIAGRLLILGEPGAGKTTLLLELARDLIKRAQQNLDEPIPVLFELTNWRDDKQAIGEWLMADLKFHYPIVPEKISHQWLSENKLLPLLDGLDELGLTRQKKCIDKINDFLHSNFSLPLVVCCRREEYEQGEKILKLQGAVDLQALSEGQIQQYLRRVGVPKLWRNIQNDPDGLGELAKIPLFLSLIPVTYPDNFQNKVRRFNSENERQEYQKNIRKDLFDAYIERKLEEHHDKKGYKSENTKRWLIWLAKTMNENNLKEFYIEEMQPSYLGERLYKIQYCLIYGLVYGITFGLIVVVMFGILYGLLGLIGGLIGGLLSGLIVGLISILSTTINPTEFSTTINTVETFKIDFNFTKLVGGLIGGLIFVLVGALIFEPITGLMCGIIFWLIVVLKGTKLNNKKVPNQGIQESTKNAVIFSFIVLPIIILFIPKIAHTQSLSLNLETILILGFLLALLFGITFAGIPLIQHISLRLILWKNRSIPWNYAHFLTYTDDRKLIHQVGGRFTFIHALLQEHFAQMEEIQ